MENEKVEYKKPIREFPNKWFLIVSVGLGILILIFGGYFFYQNSMKEDNPEASPNPIEQPEEQVPTTGSPVAASVVEANNMFAVDMYKIYRGEEGNIFFSPLSISSALAMTYEGAAGETRTEMQETMHFPDSIALMRGEYQQIYEKMNDSSSEYELNLANALWGQEDFTFESEFVSDVEEFYGGSMELADFVGDPEGSRTDINEWVEKETNDKIKDLMPQGSINQDTRLVLTNAIYFKGEWLKQFSEDNTMPDIFTRLDASSVDVEMMSSTGDDAEFDYHADGDTQVLQMPYDGEEISMMVILPKRGDFKGFEKDLTAEKIAEYKVALENQRVDVYFPKFKLDTTFDLTKTLEVMGMPLAMSTAADFSRMTDEADLMISKVMHKAFVEVNEEGTEAAAATGVGMALTSAPIDEPEIPEFRADHPFIYIIHDNETGNILFMGRMGDPTLEKSEFALPTSVDVEDDSTEISMAREYEDGSDDLTSIIGSGEISYTYDPGEDGYMMSSELLKNEIERLVANFEEAEFLSMEGEVLVQDTPYYSIFLRSSAGERRVNCGGDRCSGEFMGLLAEIDEVRSSVFEKKCEGYVDCIDIKCFDNVSLNEEIAREPSVETPAVCRQSEIDSARTCTCE